MSRRTVDQPASTDTPALHGHYDGARGHEDEHRHSGGDKPHAHKGDSHLGRTAAATEYVPGGMLPKARQEAEQTRHFAGLARDDAPTEQITPAAAPRAELVHRDGQGKTGPADATVASFVTRLANLAEHDRWSRVYSFETTSLLKLCQLLEEAERHLARHDHVDPDLIRKVVAHVEGWASQRGVFADRSDPAGTTT